MGKGRGQGAITVGAITVNLKLGGGSMFCGQMGTTSNRCLENILPIYSLGVFDHISWSQRTSACFFNQPLPFALAELRSLSP